MPATDPAPTDALAIATQYAETILAAVAADHGLDVKELELLLQESFAVEDEPGAFGFLILHDTGMYGAYARLRDGKLQDIRSTRI